MNLNIVMNDYEFTNTWFENSRPIWDSIIPQLKPEKILEIGSYEGASSCYLIENASRHIDIHCVDTWEGGEEHSNINMSDVEKRFHSNTQKAKKKSKYDVNIVVHKGYSDLQLAKLLTEDKSNYFDLVYVDGSHQSPDVIVDACLGFRLCRPGGIMIFDDYLWPLKKEVNRTPKMAIDSFTNIYYDKVEILRAPLYQLYLQKK